MIEIFVPSEDYLTEKVDKIKERFAFANSVIDTANYFKEVFSMTEEVPTITINFGNAESKYNWGGSALCLDMSWYTRYKPTVDNILSAMMWTFFVWRIFVSLPSIINGVGGTFEMYEDIRTDSTFAGYNKKGQKTFRKLRGSRKR